MKAKTIMMSAAILLAAAGATVGQTASDPNAAAQQMRRNVWHTRDLRAEKSTVSGSLVFAKGRIAVQSGGATYYLRGVDRLIGFVDGLKEGAEAAFEGYAFAIPQNTQNTVVEYAFHVVTLMFNGKEYELNNNARFSQAAPRPPLPGYTGHHRNMPRQYRGFQHSERRGNW